LPGPDYQLQIPYSSFPADERTADEEQPQSTEHEQATQNISRTGFGQ